MGIGGTTDIGCVLLTLDSREGWVKTARNLNRIYRVKNLSPTSLEEIASPSCELRSTQ